MPLNSFLGLPREILSQVIESLDVPELCRSALTCEILNNLCEKELYRTITVVKYAYSHTGETKYEAIRGFFNAVKRRPERLSYVRKVDARLELRMDSGLHHALALFETLPKMPCLTDLRMEIIGGVQSHRQRRSLEQGLSWGCVFERGRMAIYKFFRLSAEDIEPRGLHALQKLQSLKVLFPSNSIGLDTDLMAYSAMQHQTITRLELKNVANAALAPPKLPRPSSTVTNLSMTGCQLPQAVYQSVFESLSALETLEYLPRRPMGNLNPGGLVKALFYHKHALRSLSIKANAEEMAGMDFSEFTSLVDLRLCNPKWDEDVMNITQTPLDGIPLPASLPPFLETLRLKDFQQSNFAALLEWMETHFSSVKVAALPYLRVLRLEAEHLGHPWRVAKSPMYTSGAAGCHIDGNIMRLGMKYLRDLAVELHVIERVICGQEARVPGPDELDRQAMVLCLHWTCQADLEGSKDIVNCARAEVSSMSELERILLLGGSGLDGRLPT